jgi:hypothetical protein
MRTTFDEQNARGAIFRLANNRRRHPLFALWLANTCVRCARDGVTEDQFEAGVLERAAASPWTDIILELWTELKPLLIETLKRLLNWLIDVIPAQQRFSPDA